MKHPPLSRYQLIHIRDTIKDPVVQTLLREISRLHGVVRELAKAERFLMDEWHDKVKDKHTDAFDNFNNILRPEMGYYLKPVTYKDMVDYVPNTTPQEFTDRFSPHREETNVRKNKTG
jgi:hypothetical protein